MKLFAAMCTAVENMAERRTPHREAHLGYLRDLYGQGKIQLAGAFVDPIDASLIIYRAETIDEARALNQADPYALAGLWTNVTVREMAVPAGLGADA